MQCTPCLAIIEKVLFQRVLLLVVVLPASSIGRMQHECTSQKYFLFLIPNVMMKLDWFTCSKEKKKSYSCFVYGKYSSL